MRRGIKPRIAAEKVIFRGVARSHQQGLQQGAAPNEVSREYYVRRASRKTIDECEYSGFDDPEAHFDAVRDVCIRSGALAPDHEDD